MLIILWENPREEILIFNQISAEGVNNVFIPIFIAYVINIIYRVVYIKDKDKPLIPALALIFVYNLLHLFSSLIFAMSILSITEQMLSNRLIYYFYFLVVLIAATTTDLEIYAYNNSQNHDIKELLLNFSKNKILDILFIHILPIITISIIALTSKLEISDYLLFLGIILWNLLFSVVIRPSLSCLIKND